MEYKRYCDKINKERIEACFERSPNNVKEYFNVLTEKYMLFDEVNQDWIPFDTYEELIDDWKKRKALVLYDSFHDDSDVA
jgi:hypothetical protein